MHDFGQINMNDGLRYHRMCGRRVSQLALALINGPFLPGTNFNGESAKIR